ncbi:MAG: flagellar basal body-associated FliL family protein [Oligoflexia bacterium]|nr:flagellar basal body-associated FliL family protein [Oligoflexia bacterium]
MAEEKVEAVEAPKGPKMIMGLPLISFLLLAINTLIVLGGFGYIYWVSLVYKPPMITEHAAQEEIKKSVQKAVEVGEAYLVEQYQERTITLTGPKGGKLHYALIEFALVCGNESCLQQVKSNQAKVDDIVQTAVSRRSYTELSSLEVKFRVKHEITTEINKFLKEAILKDFLFTNFIIQ